MLDVKSLLEKAERSADSLIVVANMLKKDELTAARANALTNSYRSAGNLYIEVVKAVEGSTITIQNTVTPTELSPADRARLDKIAEQLAKPCKRKRGKKQGE